MPESPASSTSLPGERTGWPRLQLLQDLSIRALGCLGFLLTLPLYPPIALAIKVEDRGPLLFGQKRLGYRGRPFRLLKFRTMRADYEPRTDLMDWSQTDVPAVERSAITRVGGVLRRFHLDELPQFLNVMRGELVLVGPRPESPAALEKRTSLLPGYERRLEVKPGITGWAQLHYPYESFHEKLEYDLYYIERRSLQLDVSIVLRTVARVFQGRSH